VLAAPADITANIADDLHKLGRYEESLTWYEKAIELEPGMAYAHSAVGQNYHFVRGQLDEAIVWSTRSVSLDPDRVDFPVFLGFNFLDLGDIEKAEYWIRRAIRLSADAEVSRSQMGRFARFAAQVLHLYREDESSLEDARKALANSPEMWPPLALLRNHELREGRPAKARALYDRFWPELLSEDDPIIDEDNYGPAIDLALVLIRTGERERADLLLDRSLEHIQTIPRLGPEGYGIADVQIYALQGNKPKALSALRQAIDEGWRNLWWYHVKHDPNLESLHGEPEFQAMVAEIEADMAAQLARVREMERNGELEPIPGLAAE